MACLRCHVRETFILMRQSIAVGKTFNVVDADTDFETFGAP
jgi:hypothetical protein